jgi:hypothetical protein
LIRQSVRLDLHFSPPSAKLFGFPLGTVNRLKGMPAMALDRSLLERQLGLAKTKLDTVSAGLKGKGVEEKALRRDPLWREARAEVRKITNRLNRAGDKEKLQAEIVARKAESAAAE